MMGISIEETGHLWISGWETVEKNGKTARFKRNFCKKLWIKGGKLWITCCFLWIKHVDKQAKSPAKRFTWLPPVDNLLKTVDNYHAVVDKNTRIVQIS